MKVHPDVAPANPENSGAFGNPLVYRLPDNLLSNPTGEPLFDPS